MLEITPSQTVVINVDDYLLSNTGTQKQASLHE